MIVFKTLTLAREQLATLPVYFFLAYHAASLLNAWGVGSTAGQYYLELAINFEDICDERNCARGIWDAKLHEICHSAEMLTVTSYIMTYGKVSVKIFQQQNTVTI